MTDNVTDKEDEDAIDEGDRLLGQLNIKPVTPMVSQNAGGGLRLIITVHKSKDKNDKYHKLFSNKPEGEIKDNKEQSPDDSLSQIKEEP